MLEIIFKKLFPAMFVAAIILVIIGGLCHLPIMQGISGGIAGAIAIFALGRIATAVKEDM